MSVLLVARDMALSGTPTTPEFDVLAREALTRFDCDRKTRDEYPEVWSGGVVEVMRRSLANVPRAPFLAPPSWGGDAIRLVRQIATCTEPERLIAYVEARAVFHAKVMRVYDEMERERPNLFHDLLQISVSNLVPGRPVREDLTFLLPVIPNETQSAVLPVAVVSFDPIQVRIAWSPDCLPNPEAQIGLISCDSALFAGEGTRDPVVLVALAQDAARREEALRLRDEENALARLAVGETEETKRARVQELEAFARQTIERLGYSA